MNFRKYLVVADRGRHFYPVSHGAERLAFFSRILQKDTHELRKIIFEFQIPADEIFIFFENFSGYLPFEFTPA